MTDQTKQARGFEELNWDKEAHIIIGQVTGDGAYVIDLRMKENRETVRKVAERLKTLWHARDAELAEKDVRIADLERKLERVRVLAQTSDEMKRCVYPSEIMAALEGE